MYFDKIRLVGRTNVDLPIHNLDPSNNYILKGADGLGPTEIDVAMGEAPNEDNVYQGSNPQGREAVILVALNPNYAIGETVEGLREELYGMITTGTLEPPRIEFWSGPTIVAESKGYVKRCEIVPFTKDPQVQITYSCLSPYLYAPTAQVVDLGSLSKSEPHIFNPGSAPTGFHMEWTLTSSLTYFQLTSLVDSSIKLKVSGSFDIGDKFIYDTAPGNKSIKMVRDVATISLLALMSSDSDWIQLEPGDNPFSTSSSNFNWDSVYFTPRYWGV